MAETPTSAVPADGPPGVSLVITSCGRLDLLDATLASFFRHNTCPLENFILVEDAGDRRAGALARRYVPGAEVIINAERKGQIVSLDLAYAKVATPLIFHCEDDWEFLRPGFIEDQVKILSQFPQVSVVNGVARGVLPDMDAVFDRCPAMELDGIPFRIIAPDAHEIWFGYSFNPGLRRTSDYWRFGPFAAVGHEADVSVKFKSAGLSMAVLGNAAFTHIGDGRHVNDPVFPITASPAFLKYWLATRSEPRPVEEGNPAS